MIIEEKNIITKDNICREILKKLINYNKKSENGLVRTKRTEKSYSNTRT